MIWLLLRPLKMEPRDCTPGTLNLRPVIVGDDVLEDGLHNIKLVTQKMAAQTQFSLRLRVGRGLLQEQALDTHV